MEERECQNERPQNYPANWKKRNLPTVYGVAEEQCEETKIWPDFPASLHFESWSPPTLMEVKM